MAALERVKEAHPIEYTKMEDASLKDEYLTTHLGVEAGSRFIVPRARYWAPDIGESYRRDAMARGPASRLRPGS